MAQRALQTVIDEAMENCHMVQELLPYHKSVFALEKEYEGLGLEEYDVLFKLSEEHYGDAIDISVSCLN